MPRSASLRNYFELLSWDLTGDYIRRVLCSQSKGAEGNEVCPTFISEKMNDLLISAGAYGRME